MWELYPQRVAHTKILNPQLCHSVSKMSVNNISDLWRWRTWYKKLKMCKKFNTISALWKNKKKKWFHLQKGTSISRRKWGSVIWTMPIKNCWNSLKCRKVVSASTVPSYRSTQKISQYNYSMRITRVLPRGLTTLKTGITCCMRKSVEGPGQQIQKWHVFGWNVKRVTVKKTARQPLCRGHLTVL